jgi:hypothetical protein
VDAMAFERGGTPMACPNTSNPVAVVGPDFHMLAPRRNINVKPRK